MNTPDDLPPMWLILKWNQPMKRWEETHYTARSRGEMEDLVKRLQRGQDPYRTSYCSVPHMMYREHVHKAVEVWDYQGEGSCWETECRLRPSYEATSLARTTLVCHRHIVRYLRAHTELKGLPAL